jgi:hypothetical protein
MFAHPRCPCTRASLTELERLVTEFPDALRAVVLFVGPTSTGGDWCGGSLRERAESISGVTVADDHDGREAREFHVETSGHVVFYDAAGRLLFSGGITPARGHTGDSEGGATIMALLAGRPAHVRSAPVFGCPLFDGNANCSAEAKSCP